MTLVLLVLVGCVAFVVLATVPSIGAQDDDVDDLRERREQVRREKAEQAKQVDARQAEADVVANALDVLDAELATQEAKLAGINQALAVVETDIAAADERVVDMQDQIAAQREVLARAAVEAYVRSPNEGLEITLGSEDVNDAVKKSSFRDVSVGRTADAVDQMRRIEAELEAAEQAARQARDRVEDYRTEIERESAQIEELRVTKAAFYEAAEQRLEAALAEAQSIAAIDKELSDKIASEEREIAARLARQRSSSGGGGGGGSVTITDVGEIVSVGSGIRVHVSIADDIEQLLADARSDGVDLAGGGFRDPAAQVRLRRSNCGTSNYAIYQMPASRCRPPTARPGQSMHERGLAIDFTYNGRIISSRGSEAFVWLNNHADDYGLQNLPSEPWHWSVNGR